MVAFEPVRDSRLESVELEAGSGEGEEIDTFSMTVRQITSLLRSMPRPDPRLYARLARDPRMTVRNLAYRRLRSARNLAGNEHIFREGSIEFLAGADEAGRGALAGPLVAAAVMFPPGASIDGLNDSKLLEPEERERLYGIIIEKALGVSLSYVDPMYIDRWGLQLSNYKALGDAITAVGHHCQCVICDYFSLQGMTVPVYGFPKADETFQSVAAASVVAKVERDRLMIAMHDKYPRYNFAGNKGYGTEEHLFALKLYGPCEIHRISFNGVLPGGYRETSFWDEQAGGERA